MTQVERLIENLEDKYKVPVEPFLEEYASGKSTKQIARLFRTTEWAIRAVASALNLRMKRKFRKNDLTMLKARFDSKVNEELIDEIKGLHTTIEQLSHDLHIKTKALQRERNRLAQYRKIERKLVKQEELIDLFSSKIEDSVLPIEFTYVMSSSRAFKTEEETIQFVMLSDLHAETLVHPNDVGESNEFSWEIMLERLDEVIDAVHKDREPSDTVLHGYLLGDLISGIIHDSLESTTKHPVEAVVELSDVLVDRILSLVPYYEHIALFTVSGNHERLTQEIKSVSKGFDFGFLLYKLMEAKLRDVKNLQMFISTTGLNWANVNSDAEGSPRYIGLHHGDQFRGQTGSSPRALQIKEAFRQQDIEVTHIAQGHTHIPKVTSLPSEGFEIVNGSLIGTNAYSHTAGFIGVHWSQTIGRWGKGGVLESIKIVGQPRG